MRDTTLFDRLLLAGSAFGAGLALGLLLAPEAGHTTRTRIAESARDASQAAQDRSRELAAPVAERARETATALSERHMPLSGDWDVIDAETIREVLR